MLSLEMLVYAFFSLILTIAPIPDMLYSCWPAWLVLFFYWLNHFKKNSMPTMWIWILGLVLDSMTNMTMGIHVLALLLLQAFISRYRGKFLLFPTLQQIMFVTMGTAIYVLVIQWFSSHADTVKLMFYILRIALMTAFCWPWIEFLNHNKKIAARSR
jgi:rod shape-determining protein MreD